MPKLNLDTSNPFAETEEESTWDKLFEIPKPSIVKAGLIEVLEKEKPTSKNIDDFLLQIVLKLQNKHANSLYETVMSEQNSSVESKKLQPFTESREWVLIKEKSKSHAQDLINQSSQTSNMPFSFEPVELVDAPESRDAQNDESKKRPGFELQHIDWSKRIKPSQRDDLNNDKTSLPGRK